jgi:DNA-binding NtrC family response regulator
MEKFLLVSNDPFMNLQLSQALREQGYQVALSVDEQQVETAIENESYDVMLIDPRAASGKCASLFRKAKSMMPKVLGVILGDELEVQCAPQRQSEPDLAFLKRPSSVSELLSCIARLARVKKLSDEASSLRTAADAIYP